MALVATRTSSSEAAWTRATTGAVRRPPGSECKGVLRQAIAAMSPLSK